MNDALTKAEPDLSRAVKAQPYVDAMKVDIINMLEKDRLGVYEIRRIQKVTKAMIDFLNSIGTFSEKEGYAEALQETADGAAPTLHKALMERTFDGQEALKKLYTDLLERYAKMGEDIDRVKTLGGRLRQELDVPEKFGGVHPDVLAKRLGLPSMEEMDSTVKQLGGGTEAPQLTAGEDEEKDDGDA